MGKKRQATKEVTWSVTRTAMAGRLYFVARSAYDRLSKPGPSETNRDEAYVAIVFAVAAAEAFFNELVDLAKTEKNHRTPQSQIMSLGAFGQLARGAHLSIRLKYLLAPLALGARPYNPGEAPYQEFDLLVRCRNALVHREMDTEIHYEHDSGRTKVTRTPPFLTSLKARKLVALPPAKGPHGVPEWAGYLISPLTEKWACNSAQAIVHAMFDALPEGRFRELVAPLTGMFERLP